MYRGTLDEHSNKATWIEDVEVTDEEGTLIDLTDATIVVEVRAKRAVDDYDTNLTTAVLSATTANGKAAIQGTGVFRFTFTEPEMNALCAGTYDIGVTVTRDGVTDQQLIGLVPILDGVVT